MIGVHRLIDDLRAIGLAVEGPLGSNGLEWLIVNSVEVFGGRFDGATIRIAVPVPGDFPATPPGGLYVSPKIVPAALMSGLGVHDRNNETAGLLGEWQYWSRPVPPGKWRASDAARRLVAHWNTVMANAN